MPGFPLFLVRQNDEIEYYQNEIELILKTALNSIELKDKGVYVQASTLGSLEAFLQLLKTSHIPVRLSSNNWHY
jgi:translation initiation factor 5B